jgi:hypothetical protein
MHVLQVHISNICVDFSAYRKNIRFYPRYNLVNVKTTNPSAHVVQSRLVCYVCHLLVYWIVKGDEILWVFVLPALSQLHPGYLAAGNNQPHSCNNN